MPRLKRSEQTTEITLTADQQEVLNYVWRERERTGAWPKALPVVLEFERRGKKGRNLIMTMPGDLLRKDHFSGVEKLYFGLAGYATSPEALRVATAAAEIVSEAAKTFVKSYPAEVVITNVEADKICEAEGADPELVVWILQNVAWQNNWQKPVEGGWRAVVDLSVLQFHDVEDGRSFLKTTQTHYLPAHLPGVMHRQFMKEVLRRWRATGTWPEYRQFCVDYASKGFAPRLISELHDRYLRKDTQGVPEIQHIMLNFRGLAATADAQEELESFAQVLSYVAQRFKAGDGELELSAQEISVQLKLPLELTARVVQLFDREEVGAYLRDRQKGILKIDEYVLAYESHDTYFSLARKYRHLYSKLDHSGLRKTILETFKAASESGFPYLSQVDLQSKKGWCGDLECHLGCPLTTEEQADILDLLYQLVDEGQLVLLGAPNEQGEVLFSLPSSSPGSVQPQPELGEVARLEREIARLQQESSTPAMQYSCLRCGRLNAVPFAIGPGDRALCPDCQQAAIPLSAKLNYGLVQPLEVDAKFGHYKLQDRLGAGGFGEVWKAVDEELGRIVALKFPKFQIGETLDRLKVEAKAAAALDHPNIAKIYTVEEDKGRTFIVMEYIDGTTLGDRALTSVSEVAKLIRDVAEAVAFAHERRIIHRDLKPDNIIVKANGHPYVTDFGLALLQSASKRLTSTGGFVGTPDYAAPEQLKGMPVDSRADIYSLGVVLFETITHQMPPKVDVMARIQELFPGEPVGLGPIAFKCLQEEREKRYQTAGELVDALNSALSQPSKEPAIPPGDPPPPASHPNDFPQLSVDALQLLHACVNILPQADASAWKGVLQVFRGMNGMAFIPGADQIAFDDREQSARMEHSMNELIAGGLLSQKGEDYFELTRDGYQAAKRLAWARDQYWWQAVRVQRRGVHETKS